MFTFEVNKNNIELTEAETITSGSVNVYFCHFVFSSDWDGLAKTITFRAGDVSISVLLDSTNMCVIPWEVLQADAVQLYAGARGTVTDTDTEEEAIIPTVYCLMGTIRKGAELGENAQPPVPSVVDQLTSRIESLDEGKQDKLHGAAGQVVSFDEFGNVIARDEKGTEYKAGENIEISADNTISAKMYDDTAIREEINSVKTATAANAEAIAANAGAIATNAEGIAANSAGIAKNTADIATNEEGISANAAEIAKNAEAIAQNKTDIAKNAADINKNAANIAKNAEAIAKNTADVKTAGDKIDALTSSLSTLSSVVTDNSEAINTAEENIAALFSSVTAAEQEITKNTSGLSAANTRISEVEASKQDKLHGTAGQVVGFDEDGNAVAQEGGSGTPGKDGTTFTPMVSPEGVLSWTNDGGKENPEAVNIRGPIGPAGTYTAGENIEISEDGVISAKAYDDTTLKTDIAKNAAAINSMKSDISANTSAIEATNANVSDISSSLQSAKSDISANTSAIENANANISGLSESKQDKLRGQFGQVVSFDENGNVIARDENVTEYKAGANISISEDNTISAKMYDDTAIRGEINSVKSKTEANTEGIAANAAGIAANAGAIAKNKTDIAKNSEAIAKNTADISANAASIAKNKTDIENNAGAIAKNTADISKNTADIANNTAGLKTVGDKVDTLTSSLSTLSKSVTDNTTAINTAEENIAALSSSVTEAGREIAKNAAGLSAANEEISTLKDSKQDKLHGNEGQVVGFDEFGNAIAQDGGAGTPGKDGVTFTPMVSESGIISWSNDGGRENPEPMNIKGPAGTYTAGNNIIISNNTISSNTGITRKAISITGAGSIVYADNFTISTSSVDLYEFTATGNESSGGAFSPLYAWRQYKGHATITCTAATSSIGRIYLLSKDCTILSGKAGHACGFAKISYTPYNQSLASSVLKPVATYRNGAYWGFVIESGLSIDNNESMTIEIFFG